MPPGATGDLPTPGVRARRPRSGLVLGGLVLAAVLSTRWVRLNLSPSVPVGVYRLAAVTPPLTPGTLVVLPVPASVQAWHSAWVPLLKPVAGVAGDVVCVWGHALWVWGQTAGAEPTGYGMVWLVQEGKALPQIEGCLLVQEGTVFLASAAPNSLDSRYFRAVPISTLTAQAFPLLTWSIHNVIFSRKDRSMEREYVTYGLRARAAQLMTWLMGPGQNQQRQQMENDRQTHDGITRGEDDPDNRARQAFLGTAHPAMTPTPQPQVQPRPALQPTSDTPWRTADLSGRAEALLQRLERQQEAHQQALEQSEHQARFQAQHRARQGGRQQGMGW